MELTKKELIENIVSIEVTEEEAPALIKLGEEMIPFCVTHGGVGLAAPQIGTFKRMFIWQIKETNASEGYQIVFNPKYYKNGKQVRMLEGCLTYSQDHYFMERWKGITAVFYTFYEGKFYKVSRQINGIRAVIFQHECDHLDGKTIAVVGEKLDDEKNKSFIEDFQKRDALRRGIPEIPNNTTIQPKASIGGAGSATCSFEPFTPQS